MSTRNPWETHGYPFQANADSVQMFDPTKFQPGPLHDVVPETQPHGFNQAMYPKEGEEVQGQNAHFADASWDTRQQQQQYQGWYGSQEAVGNLGYGNNEYGWSPSGNNQGLDVAYDGPHQYGENYDVWQNSTQQGYCYGQEGYMGSSGTLVGEQHHHPNFVGQDEQTLVDGSNRGQSNQENDSLSVGAVVGVNYPGYNNLQSMASEREQGSAVQAESSYETISFCGSSTEVQNTEYSQGATDEEQIPNQRFLDRDSKLDQQVPASSSFAKLPHHPSPFDEISGSVGDGAERERPDALSLPASTSHSRQSSCSGAKFILGSTEHIPDSSFNVESPQSVGKVEHSTEELIKDLPSHKLPSEQHLDGSEAASGFMPRDDTHPHPVVGGEQPLLPPPLAMRPGTMAGVPAQNQFRKVPKSKSSSTPDIAPGPVHIPSETMTSDDGAGNQLPSAQCTGSCGASAEGAADSSPNLDSSQMQHMGGASHFSDGVFEPNNVEPCFNQSAEAGQDHQLNIYAMPLSAHPGSSFVRVGPRFPEGKPWPPSEAGGEHVAQGSADLGNFSDKESEERLRSGNIGRYEEQHKDVANTAVFGDGQGFQTNSASFSPHLSQKKRLPPHDKEVRKEYPEIPSQLPSVAPRLHRDRTMSPATTLWENPDPLAGFGICLVPAAAAKEAVPGFQAPAEYLKNALGSGGSQPPPPPHPLQPVAGFDLLQNTGTGPGKNSTTVVPTHSGSDEGVRFGPSAVGADGQGSSVGLSSNSQPLTRQGRDHDNVQQHDLVGDVNEGAGSVGAQGAAMGGSAVTQYTVTPVESEVKPRIVAHVRNESVDSLTDEITKFRDYSSTAKNPERKASQSSTKSTGESRPEVVFQTRSAGSDGAHHPKNERGSVQEITSMDPVKESDRNQFSSEMYRFRNPTASFTSPEDMSERSQQNQRDGSYDVKQRAAPVHTVGHNPDSASRDNPNRKNSEQDNERDLPRNQHSSGGDQRVTQPPNFQNPNEKPGSKQGGNPGSYGESQSVPSHSRNPRDRQGYPQSGYEDSRSRQDYASDPHDRPRSRQGYPDEPYGRPSSRPRYPEDPYNRPRSRQGHPGESLDRPRSRQGHPGESLDRPRSRQGYPGESLDRPRSRQGYPGESLDRPSSRQGYPEHDRPQSGQSCSDEYRPRSRQDHPEGNRSRSRQDYPVDDRPRSPLGYQENPYSRSREGYPAEYYDRPRSRQGYPDAYSDDPQGRSYYQDDGRSRQRGYYERPRSRQENETSDSERRGYSDQYQDDPRSRYGTRDEYDYKVQRGYSDESYERPRSRPQESETSNVAYSDSERSYYHSRHGGDRARSDHGHGTRSRDQDRERYEYEEYYRDYYNRYMQYMYQQSGYQQYYPYQHPNRYDKGYLEEMAHYGQIPAYDPRYGYDEAGKALPGSHHNSTRGSSPGQDQLSSAADNFARGSRPGSSFSGAETSPLVVETGYHSDRYDQSYGYPDQMSYQEPARHRMTPLKFIVPHTRASFGPTGQLVHVLPNSPMDGQPGVVELIDVASLLTGSLEMDELKKFPGPLIRNETHKNDVVLYCQKMALDCRNSVHLIDRESVELMWRYLELLIKQNGTIIGTDVADLLLEGHEPMSSSYKRTDLHIACSHEDLNVDEEGLSSSIVADRSVINKGSAEFGVDEATDRFRHLLLHGRKKDALEWAMKKNLWGHALFLASKMDNKTHANIMTRFANVSMKMNDPLQTLYQIMSGRQPAAVTLIVDDKWGDWRPHLCIILSNPTQKTELDKKSIVTLGDTLASRGLFFAAQFCYVVAQVPFGHYHKKSSKIVLLGASHSSPFEEFATDFAIQCTETYEYGLSLANPNLVLQVFQVYKFIYMLRLLDYGFLEEALKYAEVLAGIIVQAPSIYSPALTKSLYNLSYGLRFCDPQRLLMDETEEVAWFQQLQQVVLGIEEGSILYQSGHGTPIGGFSTGASSEVAEILQANEFGQQSTSYMVGNTTGGVAGAVTYSDSRGQWSQAEPQQTVWNPATHSYDQYIYRDQQWIFIQTLTDPQQASLYQSNPGMGENTATSAAADSIYQAAPINSNVSDQVDGSLGQESSDTVGQFPEAGNHFKPGSSGFGTYAVPDTTYATSFSSSGSAIHDRQRTISSSSSHSQQHHSSRKSSVHGATPPATPGHQMSGPSAPLGTAFTGPKKKQLWPGEEPDENDGSSKASKADRSITKNKDGSKSSGWLGGLFNRISRPKEMILPDDKNPKIVWDKEKNRWVNTEEDPNEADKTAQPAAPPKDFEVTPTMPSKSPNEFASNNKFSRQKIRGARGQYVDVLSGSSKPSPVAPNHLLNTLPKSASMPPNVFIPNARASEEEEFSASQDQRTEPVALTSPAAAMPVVENQMVNQKTMDPRFQPPQQLPHETAPEIVNSTEGTPSMPRMFNPAQFNDNLSTPSMPPPAAAAQSHLKYGQRRIYPK